MADPFTVVFDACVLYPAVLRDILIQLATTGLFRGRWTAQIHDEWMTALSRDRGIDRARLERTRELIDSAVLDCLVTGYEGLVDSLALPDADDRHVLAAAIRCGAQVIVTKNLKHFPSEQLARHGIEAQHPDEFVSGLLDLDVPIVCRAVRTCRGRLTKPPKTAEEFLKSLEKQELRETVAELGRYVELL